MFHHHHGHHNQHAANREHAHAFQDLARGNVVGAIVHENRAERIENRHHHGMVDRHHHSHGSGLGVGGFLAATAIGAAGAAMFGGSHPPPSQPVVYVQHVTAPAYAQPPPTALPVSLPITNGGYPYPGTPAGYAPPPQYQQPPPPQYHQPPPPYQPQPSSSSPYPPHGGYTAPIPAPPNYQQSNPVSPSSYHPSAPPPSAPQQPRSYQWRPVHPPQSSLTPAYPGQLPTQGSFSHDGRPLFQMMEQVLV